MDGVVVLATLHVWPVAFANELAQEKANGTITARMRSERGAHRQEKKHRRGLREDESSNTTHSGDGVQQVGGGNHRGRVSRAPPPPLATAQIRGNNTQTGAPAWTRPSLGTTSKCFATAPKHFARPMLQCSNVLGQ